MLKCRRCKSSFSGLMHVRQEKTRQVAKIKCFNCENTWWIPIPKDAAPNEYLHRGEKKEDST